MPPATDATNMLRRTFAHFFSWRRLAVVLIFAALMYSLIVNNSWRVTSDSALYMSLGRSLTEGRGYQFNFETHTVVPPGYPALIAAIKHVCGTGFLQLRIAHALMAWACGLIAFLALRRLYGRDIAFVVFLLFVLSRSLFDRSAYFLSDVPFALVTWSSLLLVVHAAQAARHRTLWILPAALALGICPLMRINGFAVAPAAAIALAFTWRKENWRGPTRAAAMLLISLAIPAAWLIWAHVTRDPAQQTYLGQALARVPLTQLPAIYLDIMLRYPLTIGEAIFGFPDVPAVIGYAITFCILIGCAGEIRRRQLLLPALVLLQMAGLCLSAPGDRYLVPILPALYLLALIGIAAIAAYLKAWAAQPCHAKTSSPTTPPPAPQRRRWLIIACAVVLAINVGRDFKSIVLARSAPWGGVEPAKEQYLLDAANWLTEHLAKRPTPHDPIIMTDHGTFIHYSTRYKAFWPGLYRNEPQGGHPDAPRPDYLLVESDSDEQKIARQWLPLDIVSLEELNRWPIGEPRSDDHQKQKSLILHRITWPPHKP